ncbi:Maf family nucleotide pyrophosphatase [Chryseolinea lacunae]|uniref:dTTP/UTP pyrophosphatase n=1 Tax=Chryseolinea lacunae TaxID=2801331 RepID=A0ABS1KX31_9BACT|nr:Maf family nucleotide pyrophosphatase [Chryseolinea lacunae]MBL0743772.1 septum formation protein Maf [Chryseolinea lacunae]
MSIPNRPLVLASSSPRRQYLMKEAGFTFTLEKPDVEETFPDSLPVEQVARYLAEKKAEYFRPTMKDEIIVTADTVVIINNTIINKPQDRAEAIGMLTMLSGKTHRVMTGVCIISKEKEQTFDDTTEVTFQTLTPEEIAYYVDHHKPYDKAGAYGAQDWIGMVAIEKIVGSYFNVMGLPIHKVYQYLSRW